MLNLAPCRICKSDNVRLDYGYDGLYSKSVVCQKCGNHTLKVSSEREAAELWNAENPVDTLPEV